MSEDKSGNLSRRRWLEVAGGTAAGLLVGAAGGYLAKPTEIVGTTETVTTTVGGATVTMPASTVTGPASTAPARYVLDTDTAYTVFLKSGGSWSDWWSNAPVVHQYVKNPPYTIGFITGWRGEIWQEVAIAEFRREATRWKNAGLLKDYVYMDCADSIDTQLSNLGSMLTMWKSGTLDGILVDPLDPSAINGTIESIYDAGCPIFLWNDPADTTKYVSCNINDDCSFGRNCAEWLAKQLNYKGDIFFFRGVKGYPIDYARSDTALSVFQKYPDIHILAIDYGEWSYDKAKNLFLEFVSAHPSFDGIFSVGGQMSNGIVDAMVQQGIDPKKPHASEDNNGFMQQCIKYGIPACASAHQSINGAISLDLMINLLQGWPTIKMYFFPQPFYTSADFPKYVRPNVPAGVFVATPLPDSIINKVLSGGWKDVKWIPETP